MQPVRHLQRLMRNRFSALRFSLLTSFGRLILPQYRFSWYQIDWWSDPLFSRYLAAFGEANGHNALRRWTLYQLLRLVDGIEGNTAECGAYEGASSYLICAANAASRLPGRVHHIFDSFEGLSSPSVLDGRHWRKGDLAAPEDVVAKSLEPFPRYRLYKGWIPSRFAEVADERFSFVHIDVDLHDPTEASMEFFYPRTMDGGIILCDDYGFTDCPGATAAVNDYLRDKPEQMLALPAGGGFIIKGALTAKARGLAVELALQPTLP